MIYFNYGFELRATFAVLARGWSNVGAKIVKMFEEASRGWKKRSKRQKARDKKQEAKVNRQTM